MVVIKVYFFGGTAGPRTGVSMTNLVTNVGVDRNRCNWLLVQQGVGMAGPVVMVAII